MPSYKTIGVMSGTSLDGVDIACCNFYFVENRWSFRISKAETYAYSHEWRERLLNLPHSDALVFAETDLRYGELLGQMVSDFCNKHKITPFLVASHGHTIFHTPQNKLTVQIGSGAALAAYTKSLVVNDFRTQNVCANGQGAPLVPIGDMMLFSEYDICINLGGFANISYDFHNKRRAFDICPFNMLLNYFFTKAHRSSLVNYDDGGRYAAGGNVDAALLKRLESIEYYAQLPPKSLGREWVEKNILPMLNSLRLPVSDILRTLSEHMACQISRCVTHAMPSGKVLLTGGGAYHNLITDRIKSMCPKHTIVIPEMAVIEYKEALIFAFLGLLRYLNRPNCLAAYTGADADISAGAVYDGRL